MVPNDDRVEHFLVDGVAPPVIGGGPPESPFDLEPDPEPRHARTDGPPRAPGGPPHPGSAPGYGGPAGHAPPGFVNGGQPYGPPTRGPGQVSSGPSFGHADPGYYPPADREPPTSPIPAIDPAQPEPEEKRKSWVSKVFRLPG